MKDFLLKIWREIEKYLSEVGSASFGRAASAYLILYYTVQDAWLFHRTGHLVDNTTMLSQLTVMTSFYGVNKTHDWLTSKLGAGGDAAKENPGDKGGPEVPVS